MPHNIKQSPHHRSQSMTSRAPCVLCRDQLPFSLLYIQSQSCYTEQRPPSHQGAVRIWYAQMVFPFPFIFFHPLLVLAYCYIYTGSRLFRVLQGCTDKLFVSRLSGRDDSCLFVYMMLINSIYSYAWRPSFCEIWSWHRVVSSFLVLCVLPDQCSPSSEVPPICWALVFGCWNRCAHRSRFKNVSFYTPLSVFIQRSLSHWL